LQKNYLMLALEQQTIEISHLQKPSLESKLGITIGTPQPPHIHDSFIFFIGITAGLITILAGTWIVDKLGTVMYEKGFAKPFFIMGKRVHHSCIYFLAPASYAVLVGLFFLGYVHVIWSGLWVRLAYMGLIATLSICVDFLGDTFWPTIRKNAIVHHEWIYTILPIYLLTNVVNLTL